MPIIRVRSTFQHTHGNHSFFDNGKNDFDPRKKNRLIFMHGEKVNENPLQTI